MLVFERAYGIGQPVLVGQDLCGQLIQRAQPLLQPAAIDNQFADQIEEAFQTITADPDHLSLFAGLPIDAFGRILPVGFANFFHRGAFGNR